MKIVLLVVYFGEFPTWAPLYFETLRRNKDVDFIFYTDQEGTSFEAENIRFHTMTYENYVSMVQDKLQVNFKPSEYYKLCDVRPFYGIIHKADFKGYDFYGWTDMDILFGPIRTFFNDKILQNNDVISAHEVRISGHFTLIRNTEENRQKCYQIYHWKQALENPEFVGIDEHGLTNAHTMTFFDKLNEKFGWNINNWLTARLKKTKKNRLYLKEQYTTPFTVIPWIDGSLNSEQPDTWFYKDGEITNSRDGDRSFVYLHLMNFRSSRWRHDNSKAPWEGKENICKATVSDMKFGIQIDPEGIKRLT